MDVTFLGTGSAMPTGDRQQTGILLEGGDRPILVDCGSGILSRLAATDISYEGVDTVLLTHHHLDHVADLLPLLKARWLAGEETLTVVGPEGTESMVRELLAVHEYLQGRVRLTFREVGPHSFSVGGYAVTATETRHSMYCLAYRFEVPGTDDDRTPPTFTFSADTEAFPALIEFADGSAVLAHDCSFPDGIDVDNHPTPTALGEALAQADAEIGRVYLTHLYPHTDGRHQEMLQSIRDRWDGDVRLADDRRQLTIA